MWYSSPRVAEAFIKGEPLRDTDPLVVALRQREPDALRIVYRQHHDVVRAFALRLLGLEADAEELVQDTFVFLPKAIARFRGDSTLRTFLLGIAARAAKNYLRSRRRRKALIERFTILDACRIDAAERPDDALANEILAVRLQRAMEQLSDEQRLAFVLVDVEERSSFEAGEILGCPPSTVRARSQAARKKLQELLGEGEP
jgi:RNA polymerase sigma-70 factor, ECF subfamily